MKVFADSADLDEMAALAGRVDGFTTNPTLIRKSGATSYWQFCHDALSVADGKPLSLEVVGHDWLVEALRLAEFAENVYVKIPCVYPNGNPATDLIGRLTEAGVKVNVTALMSWDSIVPATEAAGEHGIVSIFAGRVADTGQNPESLVGGAARRGPAQALWASVREVWNIYQAQRCGAQIVTVPPSIIERYDACKGKDRADYELETVHQFQADAQAAGLTL